MQDDAYRQTITSDQRAPAPWQQWMLSAGPVSMGVSCGVIVDVGIVISVINMLNHRTASTEVVGEHLRKHGLDDVRRMQPVGTTGRVEKPGLKR